MGIFDRLLGRTDSAVPASPEALREQLFEAVQARDGETLMRLCAEHEAAILKHYPAWQTVPEEVRREPALLQRYGEGLHHIAQCLAQTRNRPELLQLLRGPAVSSPVAGRQEPLTRAQELMGALNFEAALELLTQEARRVQGLSGGDADRMKALTLGFMATCLFQLGRAEASLPLFQQALELCQTMGDEEGEIAYLSALFEVHRYLGQGARAAPLALKLAQALERTGQAMRARRFRKHAGIVQQGEPLNRVVAHLDDVTLELDELPYSTTVNYLFGFCRNRIQLSRTTALVAQGRGLGQQGHYAEALAHFHEAGRLDPHSPDPHYDGAVTLMHLQRMSEAVAWYDQAEALAPGWYHCRSERWLADGIATGRIPYEAFLLLRTLESSNLSPQEKMQLLRRAIRVAPGVPEFKLHLGRAQASGGPNAEALQYLTEGLEQAEEPDIRSRLLVECALHLPATSPRRQELLYKALAPGGNLVAAAMAQVMLRTNTGQAPAT
jgi:tetratricopeptide (TPR) repeat protein